MVLEKGKELYEKGELVAETFNDHQFVALLTKEWFAINNGHYGLGGAGIKSYIKLYRNDTNAVSLGILHWEQDKEGLWGIRSHGNSILGHTSTTYFPPNSEEGLNVKRGAPRPAGIDETQERYTIGGLDFIVERFNLGIQRDDQKVLLDAWQIPLIDDAFVLFEKRRGLYKPTKEIDIGKYISRHPF